MTYLDANVILRYLLQDHDSFYQKSKAIIDDKNVLYITNEVLAEVVYVLNKTYEVPKEIVFFTLVKFLEKGNIHTFSHEVIILALKIFHEKNIDFVDSILCAVSKVEKKTIVSFDKKLNKCISS